MVTKCFLAGAGALCLLAACGGSASDEARGRLAFWRGDLEAEVADIFVMDANGSGQMKVPEKGRSKFAVDPAWSPDGKQIAFVGEDGENDEVFVMNADGSGSRRLTTDPATDQSPDWSPDGRKIAWTRDSVLMVMNADGTDQKSMFEQPVSPGAVAPSSAIEDPAWSPDGREIAFGGNEIFVIATDGSDLRNLTKTSVEVGDENEPSWSPDGRQIAYSSAGDREGIFVINADGSGRRSLIESDSIVSSPAWSPDGARIAFVMLDGTNSEIFVVNADGSGKTNITKNPAWDDHPAWEPVNSSP